jgi:rhamnogalacturonyl hydrolase YesR
LAYLQLHEATREKRFLQASEAIATTLGKRQRPDGTWPFRVDPKTEAVIEDYSSSVIYAVRLFEALDKINGNHRYQPHRDLAWNWLLNGPIKTKEFRGFYEDIPASKNGRTNYDCLDTIRYLLENRTDTNGYLEMAKDLNAWVEKTFMDKIKGFEPAEGIREQLQCNVVMGIHSLNWASMLLDLAKATGDEKLKQRADQTANYITYYLQPDNRIVVGFQYNQWWYSCHAGVILYLLDFSLVGVGHAEQVAHANRLYTFDTVDNGGTTTPTTPVQFDAALTGQTLVQGAEGKALQFNAGNRGVLLGDLGLKAPATISLWLKRTSAPADMRVFSQLEGSGTQAGALRLRGLVLEIWDGRQWLPLANISDKGVWQHLALVFSEDGNLACYLNGRQTRVVTCRADFDGVPTGLGAPYLGTYGEPFQGAMDEFQIQSRALGADAVKALVPQPLLAAAKAAESEQGNWQSVAVAVKKAPIRTGWNTRVHQQFIHPPVFSYEPVEGADKYAFAISWERGSATLESATPEVDLAKVWEKLPRTGQFVVTARAIDAEGKVLTESQSPARRKPDFKGPFRPATSGYSEAGKKTAEWLIRANLDENRDDAAGIQNIRKFPTLYYASFIRLLTAAIREQPNGAGNKAALERATRYGQALLDNRTPAAWAYAQVPLTHRARGNTAQFSDDFKVLQVSRIAMAGLALLDLHEATHDKKWLDATVDIAKALKQNQLPEGRWPWRVNPETGVSVDDYTSDQAQAILLLDDLIAKHGRNEFLEARDKAVAWMLENPCKTLRWEGQWDDAIVVTPYTNLEWYDTGLFAEYLLRHATAENGYALIALQLASYIEDQFVEWEPTGNVITPGVREQYACYAVIDWHCAHYIRLCLAFHAATKDELWLKKARAMADTLTAVQHPEGCFPTWMSHTPVPGNPTALNNINYRMVFSNCSSYVGEMLLRLGAYTQSGTLRKDK